MNPLSRPVRDKPGNKKLPQPKPQALFTLFYLYKFVFFSKLAYRIAAIPDIQMAVFQQAILLSLIMVEFVLLTAIHLLHELLLVLKMVKLHT